MNKMKKNTKLILMFGLFVLFSLQNLKAQIVIGKPNLGFSQACANNSFNTYSTSFIFSPESGLLASNQFTVELSDSNGNFSNPTVVSTSNPGVITTSPATIDFSLPQDTAGENYKIRVKSSNPVATSTPSNAFAAYYKIQDSPFTINNLVSTGAFCIGGSYLLTIDSPGTDTNDSPLSYPSLTFNWFKEIGPTTSQFIANGNTLTVNDEGTYFVETNYGSCTSNSFSNRVSITKVSSGNTIAGISSSLGNPFCPDQGATTLSTILGNSYQWFKNGINIPNATNQTYETTESGIYAVQVDLGSCSATGEIELISQLFDASINVFETNSIEAGETLSVLVSSTANNPEYEWYLDNVLINNATTDIFEAIDFGNYKVIIRETSGCLATKEFIFSVNETFNPFPEVENIPNIISPNGDNINDTWVVPTKYIAGTNTEVIIMSNRGDIVMQTNDYLNNWPENKLNSSSANQVFYYVLNTDNETKKGSITIIK